MGKIDKFFDGMSEVCKSITDIIETFESFSGEIKRQKMHHELKCAELEAKYTEMENERELIKSFERMGNPFKK